MFGISLLIFIIGFLLFVNGVSIQLKPTCNDNNINIKYVPRNIYDEIIESSPLDF
jgi:hypothetical protein